ncbi:MAG: hypothetical protein A2Z01_00585 [Betaproteobacteria bacterium RBG_16_58_11]|nr:MAG: hypothetical protein A2Z01_00585 [Betaproteobacteria bacterium RBG_16_58_11]
MSYTKLLGWSLLVGFVPSAFAHPFHDASSFMDSMLHPLLDVDRVLVTDIVLLVMGIAAGILLVVRIFEFLMRKMSTQKTQRPPRPLR